MYSIYVKTLKVEKIIINNLTNKFIEDHKEYLSKQKLSIVYLKQQYFCLHICQEKI